MSSETWIFSSSKSMLLEATLEEKDVFIVTYSYLLHVTAIFDNPRYVRSIENSYGIRSNYHIQGIFFHPHMFY